MKDVSELTGFPEMMDGRVKTLHPIVHGGLLGVRDAPEHAKAMDEHGIGGIDLLYVNLYPFEADGGGGRATSTTCVENIDIGGPAMIRSAAKNHGYVAVCTDADDMAEVLAALQADGGATTLDLRKRLAARAYARTAAYDAAISGLVRRPAGRATGRRRKSIAGELVQTMRYGENPHQPAAFYAFPSPRAGRGHRAAAAGQGAQLQQHQRHRRGLRAGRRVRPGRPRGRARSSSTPTPAAWRWAATCARPTCARWSATRSRPSAASSR